MGWQVLVLLLVTSLFLAMGYFGGQPMDENAPLLPQLLSAVSAMAIIVIFAVLSIAPFIGMMISYYGDLNNPVSVFESHIPEKGWKRLLAKYVVYFCIILAGLVLAAGLAWVSLKVMARWAPDNVDLEFQFGELSMILNGEQSLLTAGVRLILSMALGLTVLTMFINFFVTVHASIRHKVKGALPITLFLAGFTSVILGWIKERLFATESQILSNSLVNLNGEQVMDLILFVLAFAVVAYLLDHQTELK